MGADKLWRAYAREDIVEDWTDRPFQEMSDRFRGSEVRGLVQEQMRRTGPALQAAIVGTMSHDLLIDEHDTVAALIDLYNMHGLTTEFWARDLAEVFQDVTDHYAAMRVGAKLPVRRSAMFHAFNLVILNFALTAYQQPDFRKHAGVRMSFWRR